MRGSLPLLIDICSAFCEGSQRLSRHDSQPGVKEAQALTAFVYVLWPLVKIHDHIIFNVKEGLKFDLGIGILCWSLEQP